MTEQATLTDRNIASPKDGVPVLGHFDSKGDQIFVHSVPGYFKTRGGDEALKAYIENYADEPLYSQRFEQARQAREGRTRMDMSAEVKIFPSSERQEAFSKVFGLGDVEAAKNARGKDIMCTVLGAPPAGYEDWVPAVDPNYIFPIDNLKAVMMAMQLNMPMLAWGMHGTGKTTLLEQYAARTNRPTIRTQHTVSTEEAHILGHYVVKNGATEFEPGPLPLAMKYGLLYIADEYDFALPSVTSVYQAVLEGKPLVIKEAPPEWRIVRPHPNFRIAATGNTNGAGDETGLYQGTQIMNSANYSRFGITIKVEYMDQAVEAKVIEAQAKIHPDDAIKLVRVASDIRKGFERGDISCTISPRELINAGKLARVLGVSPDLKKGLQLAFINRLNDVDRKAIADVAQRYFG
jgi:cobaltochelatase CobS